MFREATVWHRYSVSTARHGAECITFLESEAVWMHQVSPHHVPSRVDRHIELGFGRINGTGLWVTWGTDRQIAIFHLIPQWKAIPVPILLHLSIFLISVNKLWVTRIRLGMRKGRTLHVKVLESKSGSMKTTVLNICLPITVMWES